MNAKHTRWIANENLKGDGSFAGSYAIWTNTNKPVYIGEVHSKENAARIVACVNACERIEHPENLRENLDELGRRFNAAKAEVERLREALAGCAKQCADYENMTDDCAAAFRKARAALKGAA